MVNPQQYLPVKPIGFADEIRFCDAETKLFPG